ncbi:MAG TPA: hypothetical protein PLO06_11280 [Methanoregulaceae archaeon]|nr:hypothetical protein [Methanoregulaceae archaeon]
MDEETVTMGEGAGDDDPVEELHPETSTRKTMKKMQVPAEFIVCALFLPEINVLFLSCRDAACGRTFSHPHFFPQEIPAIKIFQNQKFPE